MKDDLAYSINWKYRKGYDDAMQDKWIPVSERLPDKPGKYLVTVQNGNVYTGTFDAYSGRFHCAATAWMDLPDPYRGDSDGKE